MAVIVLVVVIPIPAIILNILMAANLFLALAIFLIIALVGYQRWAKGNEEKIISGKTDIFYRFPAVFLLCAIFGPVSYINFTRLILIKGAGTDNKILLFFSNLISSGGIAEIIVGFVSAIAICSIVIFVTKKWSTRVAQISYRFVLDVMPNMVETIERSYARGEIGEEVFVVRKADLPREANFLGAMDGAGKIIAKTVIVMTFVMAIGIFGSVIIGTKLHGQAIQEAVETSIAFGLSGSIVFLLPLLLLSVASTIVIGHLYKSIR